MMVQGAAFPAQSPSSPSPATTTTSTTAGAVAVAGAMDALETRQPASSPSPPPSSSKRKAESQDNERLSKRLGQLNLERNGPKLYVPVETPSARQPPAAAARRSSQATSDEAMQVDDSKHKVYIYDIDDELASDSESDDGKLVFLPDIEKHLRESRIPPHVLVNSDGELAGMQMVLYSDPKSLSVPAAKDGVRKAILEARHRLRVQQKEERDGTANKDSNSLASQANAEAQSLQDPDDDAMDMDVD